MTIAAVEPAESNSPAMGHDTPSQEQSDQRAQATDLAKTLIAAISVGPVSSLINSARRTRDLYVGSWMLTVVVRAIHTALVERDGSCLVVTDDGFLLPPPGTIVGASLSSDPAAQRSESRPAPALGPGYAGVSNVLIFTASVTRDADVNTEMRTLVETAESAARIAFKALAGNARKLIGDRTFSTAVDAVEWDRQLAAPGAGPFEIYAAWSPYELARHGACVRRVRQLLALRKATRDFAPSSSSPRAPTSSLDGRHGSVLKQGRQHQHASLRLRPGEQLDVMGVTKRTVLGANALRFPSISRVAVQPWLKGVQSLVDDPGERNAHDVTQAWREFKRILDEAGMVGRTGTDIAAYPWLTFFPHEGVLLLRDAGELQDDVEGLVEPALWKKQLEQATDTLFQSLRHISQGRSEAEVHQPSPYLAVVRFDVDNMGALIDALEERSEHERLARAQQRFMREVSHEAVTRFEGICVYCEGDDGLLFLPLHTTLAFCNWLNAHFGNLVRPALPERLRSACSMRVAASICHCGEPLEELLGLSSRLMERAKWPLKADVGQHVGDAIALAYAPRAGGLVVARDNWPPETGSGIREGLVERILATASAGEVPNRVPYDLLRAAETFSEWDPGFPSTLLAIKADVQRMLRQKSNAAQEALRARLESITSVEDLRACAHELILAKQIARALSQAAGLRMEQSDE